jgi:hypothetical protein
LTELDRTIQKNGALKPKSTAPRLHLFGMKGLEPQS